MELKLRKLLLVVRTETAKASLVHSTETQRVSVAHGTETMWVSLFHGTETWQASLALWFETADFSSSELKLLESFSSSWNWNRARRHSSKPWLTEEPSTIRKQTHGALQTARRSRVNINLTQPVVDERWTIYRTTVGHIGQRFGPIALSTFEKYKWPIWSDQMGHFIITAKPKGQIVWPEWPFIYFGMKIFKRPKWSDRTGLFTISKNIFQIFFLVNDIYVFKTIVVIG